MIQQIYHVGITVSDLDQSLHFYRDILGLSFKGEILMEGAATERLFRRPGCKARVAYVNGSTEVHMPPVELIQFLDEDVSREQGDLFRTSISELCFSTEDIDKVYAHLQEQGVPCLSEPQDFDFSADGFGKSRAFYFRDPDGLILEMMQPVEG